MGNPAGVFLLCSEWHFLIEGVRRVKEEIARRLKSQRLSTLAIEYQAKEHTWRIVCDPQNAQTVHGIATAVIKDLVDEEARDDDTESIYIKRVAYDFEGKELDHLRDLTTDQYPEEIRMCAYKEVWTCSENLDFLNHLLPLMARMEISRLTECKLVKEDSVQAVFIGGAVEENVHRIIQKLDVCLKYWHLRHTIVDHLFYTESESNVQFALKLLRSVDRTLPQKILLDKSLVDEQLWQLPSTFLTVRCCRFENRREIFVLCVTKPISPATNDSNAIWQDFKGFTYSARGDETCNSLPQARAKAVAAAKAKPYQKLQQETPGFPDKTDRIEEWRQKSGVPPQPEEINEYKAGESGEYKTTKSAEGLEECEEIARAPSPLVPSLVDVPMGVVAFAIGRASGTVSQNSFRATSSAHFSLLDDPIEELGPGYLPIQYNYGAVSDLIEPGPPDETVASQPIPDLLDDSLLDDDMLLLDGPINSLEPSASWQLLTPSRPNVPTSPALTTHTVQQASPTQSVLDGSEVTVQQQCPAQSSVGGSEVTVQQPKPARQPSPVQSAPGGSDITVQQEISSQSVLDGSEVTVQQQNPAQSARGDSDITVQQQGLSQIVPDGSEMAVQPESPSQIDVGGSGVIALQSSPVQSVSGGSGIIVQQQGLSQIVPDGGGATFKPESLSQIVLDGSEITVQKPNPVQIVPDGGENTIQQEGFPQVDADGHETTVQQRGPVQEPSPVQEQNPDQSVLGGSEITVQEQTSFQIVPNGCEITVQQSSPMQTSPDGNEITSRTYHRTMDQTTAVTPDSSGVAGLEDPNADFLNTSNSTVRQILERMRGHRGQATIEAQIGRILLRGLHPETVAEKSSSNVSIAPSDLWELLIKAAEDNSAILAFTPMVTTMPGDAQYVLELKDNKGERLWEDRQAWEVTYEILCLDRTEIDKTQHFRIQLDAEKFTAKIFKGDGPICFGTMYIHGTLRSWDFRVVGSGETEIENYKHVVQAILDTLYIPKNLSEPELSFQLPKSMNVEIWDIQVHRMYRYKSPDQRSVLRIKESRKLHASYISVGDNFVHHAVSKNPAGEVSNQLGNQCHWFEFSVSSTSIEEALRLNKSLGIGEEARWDENKTFDDETLQTLYMPACQMLKKIDGVGFHNDNGYRPNRYEPNPYDAEPRNFKEEELDGPDADPEQFW